jgi:16S rRNA (guanine527-N7)-methyltransferase
LKLPPPVILGVSRETTQKLECFAVLLEKWNPAINLVSRKTVPDLWTRHILDSAQVYTFAPRDWCHWLDLGSGGGFPGLVIAILESERDDGRKIKLVESDTRKASFLRTVLRETQTDATVVETRIEDLVPQNADVVSARALAPLPTLLSYCKRHLSDAGQALLLKGESWKKEVRDAQKTWTFNYEVFSSQTQSGAVILKVRDVEHA